MTLWGRDVQTQEICSTRACGATDPTASCQMIPEVSCVWSCFLVEGQGEQHLIIRWCTPKRVPTFVRVSCFLGVLFGGHSSTSLCHAHKHTSHSVCVSRCMRCVVQLPMTIHSLWLWFRCRDLDPGIAESREPHAGNLRQVLLLIMVGCCVLGVLPCCRLVIWATPQT